MGSKEQIEKTSWIYFYSQVIFQVDKWLNLRTGTLQIFHTKIERKIANTRERVSESKKGSRDKKDEDRGKEENVRGMRRKR